MNKQEFLKLIKELPDDADIKIMHSDDILGDYSYHDPIVDEDVALKRLTKKGYEVLDATISNYANFDSPKIPIWVIS